jgi:hypothetical protein
MEHFLIIVIDKFVFEYTLAFMSPETNQEEFLSDLFLQLRGVLDNVVLVLLSNSTNALENSGKFSDIEDVMELSRGRQKSSFDLLPKGNGAVNE